MVSLYSSQLLSLVRENEKSIGLAVRIAISDPADSTGVVVGVYELIMIHEAVVSHLLDPAAVVRYVVHPEPRSEGCSGHPAVRVVLEVIERRGEIGDLDVLE